MIIDLDGRSAVSLASENESASYAYSRTLDAAIPSSLSPTAAKVRLVVELRRNMGGMMLRAQLGGEFVPGFAETRLQVCVMEQPFDSGLPATCRSFLGKPLIPGLPSDFAQSALNGLERDLAGAPLPMGLIRVDRAGHDLMGSSETAFLQTAQLLRCAFAVTVAGGDINASLRSTLAELVVQ
jgi:hypothetical protein